MNLVGLSAIALFYAYSTNHVNLIAGNFVFDSKEKSAKEFAN